MCALTDLLSVTVRRSERASSVAPERRTARGAADPERARGFDTFLTDCHNPFRPDIGR